MGLFGTSKKRKASKKERFAPAGYIKCVRCGKKFHAKRGGGNVCHKKSCRGIW